MSEEWRRVAIDARVEVSSEGRLRRNGAPIPIWIDDHGYPTASVGGRPKRVHQLMLRAFVPPPREGLDVRHLDDVKTNNRLGNLAWGTRSQNKYDEVANGHNVNANKKHCPAGHPYDAPNTHTYVNRVGHTRRYCITCRRKNDRERKMRMRHAAKAAVTS